MPARAIACLLVAGGEWQDRRRDHRAERRIRAEDEDRRRADEGVRDEADDRRVQAGDRRQAGQLRVGHALRHEQGDEDDAGDQVAGEERPVVRAGDPDPRDPSLDRSRLAPTPGRSSCPLVTNYRTPAGPGVRRRLRPHSRRS